MFNATPAQIVLVSATDEITIRAYDPTGPFVGGPPAIACSQWDLGSPEVRTSVANRPGADGTIDRSAYTGARTVTLDLSIFGSPGDDAYSTPYHYVERLVAMTHPGMRPTIRISRETPDLGGQTWEMQLRGNAFSIAYGRAAATRLDLQLTFTAPLGYLEGDLQTWQSNTASDTDATGFTFPVIFPLETGTTSAAQPILELTVGGTAPVTPILYIYGPVNNPTVLTDDGEKFYFSGLTLAAGQYVQVDMGAATVRLMGRADASVYSYVDFNTSTFWTWQPGIHVVRYTKTSGFMTVQWRDRRFTV